MPLPRPSHIKNYAIFELLILPARTKAQKTAGKATGIPEGNCPVCRRKHSKQQIVKFIFIKNQLFRFQYGRIYSDDCRCPETAGTSC